MSLQSHFQLEGCSRDGVFSTQANGVVHYDMVPPPSAVPEAIARLREMQHRFRREPLGGRMLSLKKAIYWFTASAFDRQAKIQDATLALLEDFAEQVKRLQSERELAGGGTKSREPDPDSGRVLAQVGHLTSVLDAPVEMVMAERVLLYALVRALRPTHVLEIGSLRGGSAAVMCGALDDVGEGHLFLVDPNPQISPETWERIAHRSTLVRGSSPEVLPEARSLAAEGFDFALIDGDHTRPGVLRDIEGTLPLLASEAYLLLHDCHYLEVEAAIDASVRANASVLTDCGVLSVQKTPQAGAVLDGHRVIWGGLRLLRYRR